MRIGFYLVWRGDTVHYVLADMMLRSVRKHMPSVEVVQLTDEKSPAVYGVNEVRRLPDAPRDVQRVEHLCRCEGDWVFVDTDVLFQRDVSGVFDYHWTARDWDIGLCDRDGCLVEGEDELEFIKATPYNLGVIFSRSRAFWRATKEKLLAMSPERQDWLGIQFGACEVIADGWHGLYILPGKFYNYAPHDTKDEAKDASIVHYKGPFRKRMMLDRFLEV